MGLRMALAFEVPRMVLDWALGCFPVGGGGTRLGYMGT